MGKLFMKSLLYLCVSCMAILMPFGLTSCAADDELAEYKEYDGGGIKSFTSFTATLDDVAGTRAYLDAEATDGIRRVHWNLSDVIYVYSDTDTELKKYEMTSLSEDDHAVFSGEEVIGNKFYAVYARNREITVDEDNYNIMHFSRAGMTSTYGFHGPLVATTTGNALNFKQIIGIIHVTVGNINMIDRVTFSGNSNEKIGGKGYVDMSESHPVLRLDDDASTISYSQIFNDSFDDKYTDLYICIPPTIFEDGFSVLITGKDSNDKEFAIEKNFNSCFEVKSGTISRFSLVDISAELEAQGSDEIIVFADPEVKQICVENWDTNGDGELSCKEAAAVTDIGTKFQSKKSIKAFNEFQYFIGVTSISHYAFLNCSSLTSILIPEGVTSIGSNAFYDCSSLESIVIPKGVTSIGLYAFQGCSNLTSIVIPEGVTSIGEWAFSSCSLTCINVDEKNAYYDSRKNCNAIIETSSNTLIVGCASTVIPPNVTSIGIDAFAGNQNLTSIMIPESVTSIELEAFQGCSSLTSIVISEGVTSIGSSAFQGCSSLKSIVIPEGVTSIGEWAFSGCSSLASIVLPEGIASIEASAFSNCSSLTSMVIPESVTSIGDYAFSNCSSLTSIVIPEGVTSIGERVFSYCSNLTIIKVDENNIYYDSRNGFNAIIETTSNTLISGCITTVIPEGVTSIGNYAFEGCSGFTTIDIPTSVVSVGEYAFRDCSLTDVVIPEGVISIGRGAFSSCSSLTSIVIPEGVTSIGKSAFSGCSSLASIVIPEGVASIEASVFYDCSSLVSIEISKSVSSIGDWAFYGCSSLTRITCLATYPPKYNWVYGENWGHYYSSTIYVPAVSVEAYKAADGWKQYASQIMAISE